MLTKKLRIQSLFQINFWTDHVTDFVVEKLVGVIVREVD